MLLQKDLPEVSIILYMILQMLPSVNILVLPLKVDKVKQHIAPYLPSC